MIEQQQPDILESMELAGEIKKLFRLMREKLTDREQEILVMRYGLLGKREQTQNEIGDRLGISRSYVSRIEKKAIGKLRAAFELAEETDSCFLPKNSL